jgi:hypothetical protein
LDRPLFALGIDLLRQDSIVPQQSVLRQCALDTDGHRGEEEKSGEAPSGHEEKTAPVRASLQHAFAMHWPHERVCDGKREIEMGDPAS